MIAGVMKGPSWVQLPLRLGRGGNDREHHQVRHKRVQSEKWSVGIVLNTCHPRPELPCVIRLVRISPSPVPLDDDNLVGSLKGTRDAVAARLGVDDGRLDRVRFETGQERGAWAVRIEWRPA